MFVMTLMRAEYISVGADSADASIPDSGLIMASFRNSSMIFNMRSSMMFLIACAHVVVPVRIPRSWPVNDDEIPPRTPSHSFTDLFISSNLSLSPSRVISNVSF